MEKAIKDTIQEDGSLVRTTTETYTAEEVTQMQGDSQRQVDMMTSRLLELKLTKETLDIKIQKNKPKEIIK